MNTKLKEFTDTMSKAEAKSQSQIRETNTPIGQAAWRNSETLLFDPYPLYFLILFFEFLIPVFKYYSFYEKSDLFKILEHSLFKG